MSESQLNELELKLIDSLDKTKTRIWDYLSQTDLKSEPATFPSLTGAENSKAERLLKHYFKIDKAIVKKLNGKTKSKSRSEETTVPKESEMKRSKNGHTDSARKEEHVP